MSGLDLSGLGPQGNGGVFVPTWKETTIREFAAGIGKEGDGYKLAFRLPDGTAIFYVMGPLLTASLFGQYERLRDEDTQAQE